MKPKTKKSICFNPLYDETLGILKKQKIRIYRA